MREMKDSGIEWIGEIPKDWSLKKGRYLFVQRADRIGGIIIMKMKKASRKVLAMMAVTALMSGVSVVGAANLTMSAAVYNFLNK